MTYAQWKKQVLSGPPLDIDNSGDFDCVDVVKSWATARYPGKKWLDLIGYGDAKDLFSSANLHYFDKIQYKKGMIPKQGDIMVFGPTPAPGYTNQYKNPYGHTGVVDAANASSYTLIQQESGTGSKPHLATWPWNYRPPIGILRPVEIKKPIGGTTMSKTDKADLDAIYQYGPLGRKRKPGEGEDVYLNKEVSFVLKDHYNSKEAKDKRAKAAKPVATKPDPDGSKWRSLKSLLGIK